MSKYTRLNKINHFHDSGSNNASSQTFASRTRAPLRPVQANRSKISNNLIQFYEKSLLKDNMFTIQLARTSTKMDRNLHSRQLKLAFTGFISIFLLLLISIDRAHSLNCYHCSSMEDPGCDEAFTGKSNYTDTNCARHVEEPVKVCRKIIQYIEHKKVVLRTCGFIDDHEGNDRKPGCFKRSGTFAIMMESCICYEDNCNHSATLVPNRSVLSILASCSLVIFYYLNFRQINRQSTLGNTSR